MSNQTIVIQATALTTFKESKLGFSKHFVTTSESSLKNNNPVVSAIQTMPAIPGLPSAGSIPGESQLTNNDFNRKTIVLISRTNWNEKRDQVLEGNPLGIVIMDTEVLRPSSPLPDLGVARYESYCFTGTSWSTTVWYSYFIRLCCS